MWRWDQGRLLYFQYDVLKEIAKVLVKFDGIDISQCEEQFRGTLINETGMPFLPENYTIKRNYARVFQCAFLAGFSGNRLFVTDVCRELAKENGKLQSADDFLLNYVHQFRFPFPAFSEYNITEPRCYPFCAILKFLLAREQSGIEAKASLDDLFSFIIGNGCTGLEDLHFYQGLRPAFYAETKDERRQLREMVIVLSQLNIIKVYGDYLYLEKMTETGKKELWDKFLSPSNKQPKVDRMEELQNMASLAEDVTASAFETFSANLADHEFLEGSRKWTEHLQIERSSLLRKYYRKTHPKPVCCACGADMRVRYPWTDYILDIHHLLPLSSALAISSRGTSLADIVGVCPSCHRAIHLYYRKWLKTSNLKDFRSREEAYNVYLQATKEIAS